MQENGILLKGSWQQFLTLPSEEPILVKRRHWFILVAPLCFLCLITLVSFGISLVIFLIFLQSPPLFFISLVSFMLFFVLFFAKILISWYFFLYIVTTRKLLEVTFTPLAIYQINDVLLGEVRCTEIDIKQNGIINELLDIGTITITFDRPTHQEEFTFSSISNSREIGALLSDKLSAYVTHQEQNIWYRDRKRPNKYRFTQDIFSNT